MLREFRVEANIGRPQVAYKETVTRRVQSEGRFVARPVARGQFGHCWLDVEPLGDGAGFEFVNKIVGGAILGNTSPPWSKACALPNAGRAGYPLVEDVRTTLYDGSIMR